MIEHDSVARVLLVTLFGVAATAAVFAGLALAHVLAGLERCGYTKERESA